MLKVIRMGTKLNVVDDNNNFVGFDTKDDSDSRGGYFIADKEITENPREAQGIEATDFPEYVFDEAYFKDHMPGEAAFGNYDNIVIFRLRKVEDWSDEETNVPVLYLHLYNCHNGYYAKRWKSNFGGPKEGCI